MQRSRRSSTSSDSDETLQEEEIGNEEEEEEEDEDEDEEEEVEEQPVWTFRVLFLGSISGIFLLILNQFFLYETAQCIMSMVSMVAVVYPIGHIMAIFMPKRRIYLPTFGLEFSLNPGPFDKREFVLISIFANAGAAYGCITTRSVPNLLS